MDPDANLKEQRELLKKINEYIPFGDDTEYVNYLNRLAELTEAMDGWLSKGGFLPQQWRR